MGGTNAAWYVVHTQARAEQRAERHLLEQGFRVFLPTVIKSMRHARRIKHMPIALFPRYTFVAFDLARDRWQLINSTVGVSWLITANDRPLQLPDGFVEGMIAGTPPGCAQPRNPDFRLNELVRLTDGPFAELIGRIQQLDERGRVNVLLEIMGRAVSVRTSVSNLKSREA